MSNFGSLSSKKASQEILEIVKKTDVFPIFPSFRCQAFEAAKAAATEAAKAAATQAAAEGVESYAEQIASQQAKVRREDFWRVRSSGVFGWRPWHEWETWKREMFLVALLEGKTIVV